jgi:hypothetical protein
MAGDVVSVCQFQAYSLPLQAVGGWLASLIVKEARHVAAVILANSIVDSGQNLKAFA